MVSKDPPVPPRRHYRPRRPRLPSIKSLSGFRLSRGSGRDSGKQRGSVLDEMMRWAGRDTRGRRGRHERREGAQLPDVRVDVGGGGGGGGSGLCSNCLSACCCCGCCCCCLNLEYLRTRPGILRVAQLTLSWVCNWLLGRYALRVAATLGSAMPSFFLATSSGALGCSLLLAVALLSVKSVALLRASLFEIAFHATAVGLYASQASYLHVATSIYLEPYKNDLEAYTYAGVVTSYWLGYILAALHSLDTIYSLKHFASFRCLR